MTCKVEQVAQNDPQELISHITHLHNLLKNLPSTLPLNPAELHQMTADEKVAAKKQREKDPVRECVQKN